MVNKLVYGVGINDADYQVNPRVSGNRDSCLLYRTWTGMLMRCYSKRYQSKRPSYIGCTVCEEWLTFSNFKSWMEKQDWHGKQLDKDLLCYGNRVYTPVVCVFISQLTNAFLQEQSRRRGDHPLGVSIDKPAGKFRASVSNPITKSRENLGYFDYPQDAHQAWRKRKHELACRLADMQDDPRVAEALRKRYI